MSFEGREIEWTIDPKCIELVLGPNEVVFGHEEALAHLLSNGVVFLGDHWHRPEISAELKIGVNVICNDTFGYACADCEPLPWNQIEPLWRLWRASSWGTTARRIARRKQHPIAPCVKHMTLEGWDVEALVRGELPSPEVVEAPGKATP